MTNLDLLMEFLLAAAFLWIGFAQILSYRRRPKALGADNRRLPLGLPYGVVVAIGIFEIVAALALVVSLAAPYSPPNLFTRSRSSPPQHSRCSPSWLPFSISAAIVPPHPASSFF